MLLQLMRRSSEADKVAFLSMDLSNSESVAYFIPRLEGYGQIKLIPLQFRAGHQNPRKNLLLMDYFRHMSEDEQKLHIEATRNLQRKQ